MTDAQLNDDALRQAASAWCDLDPDADNVAAVQGWLAADHLDPLREAFGATLTFGTGGMRGPMGPGTNRMNRVMVQRVTRALGETLLKDGATDEVRARGVAIAYDARRNSRAFAEDAAGVLVAMGFRVLLAADVAPTPVLGWVTTHFGCAAGVIVTASHNPPADNGYKVFWSNGAQIVSPVDTDVQAAMAAHTGPIERVEVDDAGGLLTRWGMDDLAPYFAAVQQLRVREATGARLVYTPVHGVGRAFVERALADAGHVDLHVVPEQADPDGAFPTVTFPNPEEPGVLDLAKALATQVGADAILANDPDADRLAVAIPDGDGWRQLSGNELGVLLADELLSQQDTRPDDLVVSTIVSTAMTARVAAAHGVAYDEALTGFKWIAAKALAHEATGGRFLFGFEESIGYSVGSLVRDKDGVSAALVVADMVSALKAQGRTLADRLEALWRTHGLHQGRQVSLRREGLEGKALIAQAIATLRAATPTQLGGVAVAAVRDLVDGVGRRADGSTFAIDLPSSKVVAFDLADGSRVLVRPSGTEPKIKVYLEVVVTLDEGTDVATAQAAADARLDRLQDEILDLAGLARG